MLLSKGFSSLGKEMTRLTGWQGQTTMGQTPETDPACVPAPAEHTDNSLLTDSTCTWSPSHCLPSKHCSNFAKSKIQHGKRFLLPHSPALLCRPPTSRTKPPAEPKEASLASRHQRSHAAGVCMGSHTLEICSSFPFHCPDTAKMLHLQRGKTSWLRGHRRFSQQQHFLKPGTKAVRLLSAIYMLHPE